MKEEKVQKFLAVMEHFYTIQGEGYYQGRAAYFVRLAGCDVGCTWCDVKESWNELANNKINVDDIIDEIKKTPAKIVVVTGGEPLMQHLQYFTLQLKQNGFATHLETSGAHAITGNWDWICLSPKKFKKPLLPIVSLANELKIIVFNQSDFKWAEEYALLGNIKCKLYLQPEWDKKEQMLPLIIEYIKQYPQWELSLQLHKYIHVP